MKNIFIEKSKKSSLEFITEVAFVRGSGSIYISYGKKSSLCLRSNLSLYLLPQQPHILHLYNNSIDTL